MTHTEITNGLMQLGFDTGWVATDGEITLWDNAAPQPTAAAIAQAATLWANTLAAKEAAAVALKASAISKLIAGTPLTEAEAKLLVI